MSRLHAASPALIALLALMALAVSAPAVPAMAQATVDQQPPVVTATAPVCGDLAVSPGLTEIRVTFSRPMQTRESWSFVMADKASFPAASGAPRFLPDGRTCLLPVKLQPGHDYVIWLNSRQHTGFRDQAGKPAVPYLLYFRTAR